jgi:hypothetical protein
MKKVIKWPSIEQFRSIIRNVQHKAQYVRTEQDGIVVLNRAAVMPTLDFEGTVKLHGTNASVVLSPSGEMYAQSRENIITVEKDNAGFAFFVEENKRDFTNMVRYAAFLNKELRISHPYTIIYGEWCGGSIQKGVALNGLSKMFVVFGIAFSDEEGNKVYAQQHTIDNVVVQADSLSIKNIYDFQTFEITIDFNQPLLSQNTLGELTLAVEQECPVARQLGISGVGEGIVWRCVTPGYEDSAFWFKVKGEKHSASRVKTLAAVDVEKVTSIAGFVDTVLTDSRLQQGVDFLVESQLTPEPRNIGTFLSWVNRDVLKEEADTMAESGIKMKEVGKELQRKARTWFLHQFA